MHLIAQGIELWQNRERRNRWILAVLSLITACIIVKRILERGEDVAQPAGALTCVICVECQYRTNMLVHDINDPKYVCHKCGGKLALAWKCDDCQFEYPLVPRPPSDKKLLKTMAKFNAANDLCRCPNCGSTSTSAIPPQ